MKTFTLTVHPGTTWKVRVVVHPSLKSLRTARAKAGGESKCSAFCYQFGTEERYNKNLIAEMHFYRHRGKVENAGIVHECAHAAVAWANHIQIDFGHCLGDEHFAECMEHLVEGTRDGLKLK